MRKRETRRWWRKKRWWAALFAAGFFFLLVAANVLASRHARAMLTFVPPGQGVTDPAQVTFSDGVHYALHGVPLEKPQCSKTPADLGMEYTTHTVPVDDMIRLEAWYVPARGTKATVLFFHGRMAAKDILLGHAAAVHEAGYGIFLVDFRASGGSNQFRESLGYYEADDVAASVRYVRANITGDGPIFLYGQSMGAAAVIRAAAVHQPDVNGIILHSVFDTLEHAVQQQFKNTGVPVFPAVPVMMFWGGRVLGIDASAHNPVDYARDLSCPVLLLHGTRDFEAPIGGARRVHDAVPGESELIAFQGLGHVSLMHEEPALWRAAVFGFLEKHSG